jgi:CheY-like chemotaxis protein
MSVSILIVDDEPDVADLFRQRFRRETRGGTYVLHFAASGEDALDRLTGEIKPPLIVILLTCQAWTGSNCRASSRSSAPNFR